MTNRDLINFAAEAAYEKICDRALQMAMEAFPGLTTMQKALLEAGIAAGATAAIQTFVETGALKRG